MTIFQDILNKVKQPWIKKVSGKYTDLITHVLHPHGVPLIRKLWTTQKERDEHDRRMKK